MDSSRKAINLYYKLIILHKMILSSSIEFTAPNYDITMVNPYDIIATEKYLWVTSVTSSQCIKYKRCSGKNVGNISVPSPTALALHGNTLYIGSQNGNVYKVVNDVATLHLTVGAAVSGLAAYKKHLYVALYENGIVRVYSGTTITRVLLFKSLFNVGYKPYGLAVSNCTLYISLINKSLSVGNAYIATFKDKTSNIVISRGPITYTYGMDVHNDVLYVANFPGDVQKYSDKYVNMGPVRNKYNAPVINDGIHGISIYDDKIYFVANILTGSQGVLGYIDLKK